MARHRRFLDIDGVAVTGVPNDSVYDLVIGVSARHDEVADIAERLRALVED